jgi:lactose/L-arabinose transport system permease protein
MAGKQLNMMQQTSYMTNITQRTKLGKIVGRVLMYGVLTVGGVVSLFPFYFAFIAATHKSDDVLASPPNLLPGGDLIKNLDHLMTEVKFGDAMFNSACIAVIYTFLGVLVCSMAGYAFAKYKFVLRDTIFLIFLGSLMLPALVTFVPLFKMISSWTWPFAWLGSWWAVILPTIASPFGIFLMRQSMTQLPDELLDAGRIDGAGEFGTFWRIVLPVVKPSLSALAILMFMSQWNNFFWPLVSQVHTIPVAIGEFNGASIIDYGGIMTATSLSVLPLLVVFLFFQRQFISGALAGAVKG